MVLMTKRVILALVPIMLALLAYSAHAAATATPGSGFLLQMMPYSPSSWIPVATIAVLTVMLVAGLVYSLSGIIGSTNARNWSRMQIFEALLSLIFIVAFGTFSSLLFLNPQGAFSAINLVPGAPLAQGATSNPLTDCTGATSVYALATCDLSMFNTAGFRLANTWYMLAYVCGLVPSISLTLTPIPAVPWINAQLSPTSMIPMLDIPLLAFMYTATLTIMLLQQIQILIIASAPLFLSLFITLGLVARTFGFTRTFGGAMIAFGLGLGLIYPLMVCITYGWVNVQAHVPCIVGSTLSGCGPDTYSLKAIFGGFLTVLLSSTGLTSTLLGPATSSLFEQLGYLLAGFTFVPFLNFIIVDTFIIDFSQAIGERMNFMGLLAGIV